MRAHGVLGDAHGPSGTELQSTGLRNSAGRLRQLRTRAPLLAPSTYSPALLPKYVAAAIGYP